MNSSNPLPWHQSISDRSTTLKYQSKSIIAFQGDDQRKIGYMLSGRAKAVALSENGETTWVGYFNTGDFFGHNALLSERPPSYEIIAETDVTVLFVSAKVMEQLLVDQGSLRLEFAKDMAGRLDQMTHRLIEAFTLSAKGRICAELG
jgi:CRP-like cAMP-binding protein